MMLLGEITKSGPYYAALLESLGAYGQGRTRKAACDALAATVLDYVADRGAIDGFEVYVVEDGDVTVRVTSNDPARLIALLLRRQRELHEMSLADVATATGAKSRNGWAQYEQGRVEPSITKLDNLLETVAPELTVAIIPQSARVVPQWDEAADDKAEIDALLENPSRATAEALRAKLKKGTASSTKRKQAAR